MSRHLQIESNLSVTGANADKRVVLKPSQIGAAVVSLYNKLTGSSLSTKSLDKKDAVITEFAAELNKNKGKALVVCGINDVNIQKAVNGINEMLSSYGNTILWEGYSKQRNDSDKAIEELTNELGNIDALIVLDANPSFDIPGIAATFAKGLEAMSKAGKVTVSLSGSIDETTANCTYVAPNHNYLESWGDVNPKQGQFYLVQPTIRPLFNTRASGLSFLTWSASAPTGDQPYYEYLKATWVKNLYPTQSDKYMTTQGFWDNVLHDGMLALTDVFSEPKSFSLPVFATAEVENKSENQPKKVEKKAEGQKIEKKAEEVKSVSGSVLEIALSSLDKLTTSFK
jgi:molybdopterin-containing oxidoreductase family iron-sulfur binding subunit